MIEKYMNNTLTEIKELVKVDVSINYYQDKIFIKFSPFINTYQVVVIENITEKMLNGYPSKLVALDATIKYEHLIKREYFTKKYLKINKNKLTKEIMYGTINM